eukprot:scaffold2.g7284.t1
MRLCVRVGRGRDFPPQAGEDLVCVATYRGQVQRSAPATGGPVEPAWDATYEWEVEPRELRGADAGAGSQCKLEFERADGRKVGWVVVDLRSAKLNARRPGFAGAWLAVAGPFRGQATPEVHVLHTLAEEGPDRGAAVPAGGVAAVAWPPVSAPAAQPRLQPEAAALTAVSRGLVQDSAQRRFRLALDLRSFAAGLRLPLNLASVVVQLSLPPELTALVAVGAGGRLPPRLACLRTHPAVEVARGSEVALPAGLAAADFSAGLLTLATLLARGPVMAVDVLHREQLSEDSLLGRAHVPLAPLLQEACVEGRAGVFAMLPAAAAGAAGQPQRWEEERVQIGTLQLVMSLEELGDVEPAAAVAVLPATAAVPAALLAAPATAGMVPPAAGPTALAPLPAATASLAVAGPVAPALQGATVMATAASTAASASSSEPAAALPGLAAPAAAAALPASAEQPALASTDGPGSAQAGAPAEADAAVAAAEAAAAAPAAAAPAAAADTSAELEAAWELELWKKQEEAKWRGELRDREARRMAALEETWQQREREREAEVAAMRQEYVGLEARARQVLAAAEARERAVVVAEEGVARRRRELEREHAARLAEVEALVARLQAQCQAQLELQQQRAASAVAAAAAADKARSSADARAGAAEVTLQALREQHASTPLGRLEAEAAVARAAAEAAEARAARAAKAKQRYKEQVVALAKEVAALQRQLAEMVGLKRGQLEAAAAAVAAEEAALAARQQAVQLGALKQELAAVQQGQRGGGAGAGDEAAGKENSGSVAPLPAAGGAPPPRKPGGGQELARLLQEREALLDSGAYCRDDPLLRELDRRIRQLTLCAEAAGAAWPVGPPTAGGPGPAGG